MNPSGVDRKSDIFHDPVGGSLFHAAERKERKKKFIINCALIIERAAYKETRSGVFRSYDVHDVFFFSSLFLLLFAFNGNFYASEVFFFLRNIVSNRILVLVTVTSVYPINLMFRYGSTRKKRACNTERTHLEFDAIFYNNCQERVALV